MARSSTPLATLILIAIAPATVAQIKVFERTGKTPQEAFARCAAPAGDVDRDGYGDFVIGAPMADRPGRDTGSVYVISGFDGKTIRAFDGDGPDQYLGRSIDSAGDVNRDGYIDTIAGGRDFARVFSGKDGAVLRTLRSSPSNRHFGQSVAGVGDIDKDGFDDVAVGIPSSGTPGEVRVYSGGSWTVIHSLKGIVSNAVLGWVVKGVGDVDKDGYPDIAASAPYYAIPHVQVFSGRTGKEIRAHRAWYPSSGYGTTLAALGDVNGDGHPDYAVGAPLNRNVALHNGAAFVYSGKTGELLWARLGDVAHQALGRAVAGAGDVDGDGSPDVAVGLDGYSWGFEGMFAGAVRVLSGKDGSEIYTLLHPVSRDFFGSILVGGVDATKDGVPDLLVGTRFERVQLFSGKRAFTSNADSISVTKGGAATFTIDAGPRHADDVYFVLGSTGGRHPALRVQDVVLPLNPFDSWFWLTASQPNSVIRGSLGTLSTTGSAAARLVLPPNAARSLVGLTMHHACLVMHPAPHERPFAFASPALALRLID